MQEASARSQRDTDVVCSAFVSTAINLPVAAGGLRSPSHKHGIFTLIHRYSGYGNRGQTPLTLAALLPFVLTLPLLFTLQKFVALVIDAPRRKKLLAANHSRA